MARMRDKDRLTFKEATANMSGKEKIGYIWEYYKWVIIGSMAGGLLVFSMIHAFVTRMDSFLNITFVSGFEHTVSSFQFSDEETNEAANDLVFPVPPPGIWVDLEVTSVLNELLLDEQQRGDYEITVNTMSVDFETIQALTTHFGASVLDLIVTYIPDFNAMSEVGYFKNISELGWDIPEHMMYNEYAIYLQYFPIFDDYVLGADDLVLGISSTTQQIDHVAEFFEMLLDK